LWMHVDLDGYRVFGGIRTLYQWLGVEADIREFKLSGDGV